MTSKPETELSYLSSLPDTVRQVIDVLHTETLKAAKLPARDAREPGRREKMLAEARMLVIWKRIFRRQAERVRQWLEQELPYVDQATKARKPPPPPDWIWQLDDDDYQDLLDAMDDAYLGGVDLFRNSPAGAVGIDYTLVNARAARAARAYAYDLIKGIDDTSAAAVREAIASFIETPGVTIGDVIARLPFDEQRAKMIAVTEITRAYAEGNREAGEELQEKFPDVQVMEYWYTNNDDKVCPICGPLDGTSVPLDEPFTTLEDGPIYRPPAHVNCRCWSNTTTRLT